MTIFDFISILFGFLSFYLTCRTYKYTKESRDIKKQIEKKIEQLDLRSYIDRLHEATRQILSINFVQFRGARNLSAVIKNVMELLTDYNKYAAYFSDEDRKILDGLHKKCFDVADISKISEFGKSVSDLDRKLHDCYHSIFVKSESK